MKSGSKDFITRWNIKNWDAKTICIRNFGVKIMLRIIGVGDNVVDCNYTTGMMFPGGNSLNFAVYGKQIGHETAYLGVLGDDKEADIIAEALRTKEVDISKCVIEHGETGRCGIRLTNGDRTITDENDAGVVKSHPLQITEDLLNYIKTFDIAHSSCFSYIENQLHFIKEAGVPVIYDFSDIWNEETFDQICPNIDIAFFSGKDLPVDTLKELLKKAVDQYGCMLGITTIGGRGAIVYNGRKFYTKEPYNFQGGVVDTTGAGDSWITAFITTYFENKKLIDSLLKDNPNNFIQQPDEENYYDNLIEYCMCTGNLLARRNCLVEGSFGFGVKM
jgi:fructoselysine 6-kinase